MGSTQRESVLFLTCAEHGQANIHFATAYEFLLRDDFDVHIASYSSVGPRVDRLNDLVHEARQKAHGEKSSKTKAIFHSLHGITMVEYIKANNHIWPHSTGVRNLPSAFSEMGKIVFRDDHHNYLRTYDDVLTLIKNINPTIAAVDSMFYIGLDACRESGLEFVVLNPMSFVELAATVQPRGQVFWKFPCVGSGYAFPVPWYYILANIYLFVRLIIGFLLGPTANSLRAARKAHGLKSGLPLGNIPDRLHICPSLPAIDFPLAFMPSDVLGVGPMILPIIPVSDSDPNLAQWLSRNPTILINLGSHYITDPISAVAMASSLRTVLSANPSLQVLWKLKYDYSSNSEFKAIISPFTSKNQDRIRITNWIVPEMSSILAEGNVVGFVHHGGANSYYEACYAGVPHIVLPPWYDCYQNATKADYLGIGIYANKGCAPAVEELQFTAALETILSDESIKMKAKEVGIICQKTVGRETACEKIMEIARKEKKKDM